MLVHALRRSPESLQATRPGAGLSSRTAYRQGVVSNLGNPKMAVFFTSLLPQFAPESGPRFAAFLALGLCFCLLTAAWLTAYAFAVARAKDVFQRPRIRRFVDGLDGRGARGARAAPRLRAALERLLEADTQLVGDVRAETGDLLEAGGAVEAERFVLVDSRLEPDAAIAEAARLLFERAQHPPGETGAAVPGLTYIRLISAVSAS